MNKSTIEAVKAAFSEFVTANTNVRERALAHGEALFKLREECASEGINWTSVLKDTGIPQSTAYDHLKFFEVYEKVREMAQEMGWEFEEMSIKQIVNSLPDPKKLERKARKASKDAAKGKRAETTKECAPKDKQPLKNAKKPSRSDEAREEAAKSFLTTTFNRPAKVYFQKRNQPIEFDLGDEVVVFVPVN